MRALKLVGIVVGCLVALLIVVLLAVRLFVNPNDYKDRIAQQVKSATGRELTLSGPIRLSVFPWIALELGPASLGNPPGFSTQPFAALRHIAVRVKLLPLLRKELQIGRLEIDGLDLRLLKNAAGKGNWQDFGGSGSKSQPASTSSGSGTLPDLAGLEIKDSRLSYQDMVADHVSLQLGHVTSGKPIPVKLKLDLTTAPGAKPIDLDGQMDVTLDLAKKQYRIAPLEISGTLTSKQGAAPVSWKFAVPQLSADLAAQTFSAPAFTVELAALHLGGSIAGTRIVDAPSFKGAFKVDPVSLRDLMGKLGITPPVTRDPKVLARLAANGNFAYGGNALAADALDIQLDDSRLRGKLAVTNLDTKATNFNLGIDRINIDRYRPPEAPATAKAAAPPAEKSGAQSSDPLKHLELNGTLTIGSATASNVTLTQLLVTIAAKNGVTRIAPIRAKLYGGDYSGDITIDDREAVPTLKIDQTMASIDMAQMLKDFAKTQRISGRGTVTTNLTAHSLGGDTLMKTLNGHVSANVDNGALEGVDLWFEINRAVALIQKQGLPGGQSSGRTKFDALKVSADLVNGVASTKDLNIASQNLRISGQGTSNLVTEAINYQVKATILKDAPTAAGAAGKSLADIPLNITGTFSSPSVRPDVEQLAKARLQQELDKHKGELQQKLMDKLKGVFH